jgi:hypothetical protein
VPQSLTFGVFPLGLAGSPGGVAAGPPDDIDQIVRAVRDLQGDGPPLLARMYVGWTGAASTASALARVRELAEVPWDLVLCYRDPAGDVGGWAGFAADVVRGHGDQLAAIQVTGEANLTGIPDAADGAFPRADEALVRGVRTGNCSRCATRTVPGTACSTSSACCVTTTPPSRPSVGCAACSASSADYRRA